MEYLRTGEFFTRQGRCGYAVFIKMPYSDRYVTEIHFSTSGRGQLLQLGIFDTFGPAVSACIEAACVLNSTDRSSLFGVLHDPPIGMIRLNPSLDNLMAPLDVSGLETSIRMPDEINDCRPGFLEALCRMCRKTYRDELRRSAEKFLCPADSSPSKYQRPLNIQPFRLNLQACADLRRSVIEIGPGSVPGKRVMPAVPQSRVFGLLEASMELPMGDFGLAKATVDSYDTLDAEPNSGFVGPFGYVATGSIMGTKRSDAFSMNTVLLKLMTGNTRGSNVHETHMIDIDDDHDQLLPSMGFLENLEKSRLENYSRRMMFMSDTSVLLGGQAIAAVISTALNSGSTSSSSVCLVESAVVLGLSFTLAGIVLRGTRRATSLLMTKLGAVATASGILISLGSHLPPVMARIVGPLAFLIMVIAAALS